MIGKFIGNSAPYIKLLNNTDIDRYLAESD